MNNEKTLMDAIREVYGESYLDLMQKDKERNDKHILNMKLSCIKEIMNKRKYMGNEPDSTMFDNLYDKELSELQRLEIEFTDMAYEYSQLQKKLL